MKLDISLNDISQTAFLTLACHTLDALSPRPILDDRSSIETSNLLNHEFSVSESRLHQKLAAAAKRVPRSLILYTTLRAKKYDSYVRHYIDKYPTAVVVNIGCGLDNRFERVDNGQINFYDLDLPGIINIKKQIFSQSERYHQISQSVFELDWMEQIDGKHTIFLAEGVFMYCPREDVKSLFLNLQRTFPGSEVVCEVFNSRWLKGWRKNIVNFKLGKELSLGQETSFQFGIKDSNEIEKWNQGIKLIDDWSYLDTVEVDLGLLKFFKKIDAFRRLLWTVHYRLE